MKIRRPKLSSAHAIALVALFVSLSGTVYAAAKLNGSSIRPGSIPANRLKADSLTGAQVNESSLGTVPEAAQAGKAGVATKAVQADQANTANTANNAHTANTANEANTAKTANTANEADTAKTANNAAQLGGVDATAFQRTCANGAIKAAAHVSGVPVDNTFHAINTAFTCTGAFEVRHDGAGIFTIRLPGSQLTGGIAVSTDPNKVNEARVRHEANGSFLIEFIQNGNLFKDDTPEFDVMFF